LRDSVRKARLCASCHVGNLDEGKFVRHEWYAAGHPPLPSFELATFSVQMPSHWLSVKEKGNFRWKDGQADLRANAYLDGVGAVRDGFQLARIEFDPQQHLAGNYAQANFATLIAKGVDPYSDLPRTKDAIVAGAAVLQVYVQLINDFATKAKENPAAWPELALYDCTACHHELRSGPGLNARPKRNHAPGRPPLAAWPTVLAKLASHQVAGYEQAQASDLWARIESQILQLEGAATQRPFGDPANMQAAAAQLSASLQQLAEATSRSRFSQDSARNAIAFLSEPTNYETRDYYTARQAAWAIRECYRDLGLAEAGNSLFQGAGGPLALDLPSGQARSVMQNLHLWLPAAASFDPTWFQNELKTIPAKLPPQQN